MAEVIPLLSLVIAALAVFVGPIITLKINQRQIDLSRRQIELSRQIAHRQIIAPMRQVWIDKLRDRLAEFLTLSFRCWNRDFPHTFDNGDEDPEYKRIKELAQEIELLINPTETDHIALVRATRQVIQSIVQGSHRSDEFIAAHEHAKLLGQRIFKTEWNRVKEELEKS